MRVFQKGSISFSQRPYLLEDSWMESKFLNHAGKEMLIKAVLTIIIKYTMGLFLLTKTWCMKVNAMIDNFW